MTVGVAVKVFDGIVLATDSATTVMSAGGGAQVYNNANKLFHLHREYPLAAMTFGLGQIAGANIATLAKDLRSRLMGEDHNHRSWKLSSWYSVQDVADRLIEFMFDELFAKTHATPASSELGFAIAGYCNSREGEVWNVSMQDPTVRPAPVLAVPQDGFGWVGYAQSEALNRLFNGADSALFTEAVRLAAPANVPAVVNTFMQKRINPVFPAMPLIDAIELARFCVDTTIGYRRFAFGPDTVGGPIDIASISRHEGFRWIQRKHYYPQHLNPKDPHG